MPRDWNFSNLFSSDPISQITRAIILKPVDVARFSVVNAAVCIGSALIEPYIPGGSTLLKVASYTSGAFSATAVVSLVYEYGRLIPLVTKRGRFSVAREGDIVVDDNVLATIKKEDGFPIIELKSKDPYTQGRALGFGLTEESIDAFHRYYNLIFPLIKLFHHVQKALRREVVDYDSHGGIESYVKESVKKLNFPEEEVQRYRGFVEALMTVINYENSKYVVQDRGITTDNLIVLMATPDIFKMLACSAHVVHHADGSRSLGRNLDWYGAGVLSRHTVGVVYPIPEHISARTGINSWFSITFAPGLPSLSGYNGHLCMTLNEATSQLTKNQYEGGLPMLIMFRRIMENCKTVEEVERFLADNPPATSCLLTVMCKNSEAIFQILPTKDHIYEEKKFTILNRGGTGTHISVTNHFIEADGSGRVIPGTESWPDSHSRKEKQEVAIRTGRPSMEVLQAVNEVVTMHSMVFVQRESSEEVDLKLRVANSYAVTEPEEHNLKLSRIVCK